MEYLGLWDGPGGGAVGGVKTIRPCKSLNPNNLGKSETKKEEKRNAESPITKN